MTREHWSSRFGFVMATAGFAIGLGNIWRFPYQVGSNGGGAFLVVYLAFAVLIGIPLMTAEISLGRRSQRPPITGMTRLTGSRWSPWNLIGWLGVALTGTDAGSNALFGGLQVITANKLGLSPVLMAAANSAGGVMGKMIDAQSIIVACAAVGIEGREGDLFRAVLKHSIVLALLVGCIVMLFAYVFPGVVPSGHQFLTGS